MSNPIQIEESQTNSSKQKNALGDDGVVIRPLTHLREITIDLSNEASAKIDQLVSNIANENNSDLVEYHSNVEFEEINAIENDNPQQSVVQDFLVPTELFYSNGETDYNVELQDINEDTIVYEFSPFQPQDELLEGNPQNYSGQNIQKGSFEVGMSLEEAEDYAAAPEEDIAHLFESYRRQQQ